MNTNKDTELKQVAVVRDYNCEELKNEEMLKEDNDKELKPGNETFFTGLKPEEVEVLTEQHDESYENVPKINSTLAEKKLNKAILILNIIGTVIIAAVLFPLVGDKFDIA